MTVYGTGFGVVCVSIIISITGSHHQVESTVFYLFQLEESHSANSKT